MVMLLIAADTCYHPTYEGNAQVTVFEDSNANGEHDRGELPISDVLVIVDSNIHGGANRAAKLTDTKGQALLSASYTHYFTTIVVPPCGYRPTTETKFDSGKAQVGFAPESPRPGAAVVNFYVWEDQNEDGVQNAGEPPLESIYLAVDPLETSSRGDNYGGILSLKTDADGRATVNLGKSCGKLWVRTSLGWKLSAVTPDVEQQEDWLGMAFDLGDATVEMGLHNLKVFPMPTQIQPAAATSSP